MARSRPFQLGQGSLQDYVDCARRFQLRYVRRLQWPAVEVAPPLENERYLQQGAAFHHLIHQHLSGLPARRLSRTVTDPEVRRWWFHYLESGPRDLPAHHHPEVELSAPVAHSRLVAQYDLVAVDPGRRAVIVDWKTNRKRPRRGSLSQRLQTRVYPYLLVRAGAHLNGGDELQPHQMTMVYWFASFPARPEAFAYDDDLYRADRDFLTGLLTEIEDTFADRDEDDLLPRTDDERRCRYCRYRSLCRRGVEAGRLDEMEPAAVADEVSGDDFDFDFDFDFEQMAEADYG